MTNMTRRGFMKGTGITAGALAFTSLTPMSAIASDKRGSGVLTSGRMGPMLCEVKDGKLVSTTNALAQTVPNSLQTTGPDQVHTKARVKYPMVRKGYLANPSAPEGVRGSDEFVRISWDEVYKLIHQQHSRIRQEQRCGICIRRLLWLAFKWCSAQSANASTTLHEHGWWLLWSLR